MPDSISRPPSGPIPDQSPFYAPAHAANPDAVPDWEEPRPLGCWLPVDCSALPLTERIRRAVTLGRLATLVAPRADEVRAVADFVSTALLEAMVGA